MAGIPYKHRYSSDYWVDYQFNFAGFGQAEPGMTAAERRAGAASATRAGQCPVDAVELPGSYGLQYTESGTAKYPYSIDGGLLYLTPAGFLRKVHELNVERCPPSFWRGATPDSWYPVRKQGGGYTYELIEYTAQLPGPKGTPGLTRRAKQLDCPPFIKALPGAKYGTRTTPGGAIKYAFEVDGQVRYYTESRVTAECAGEGVEVTPSLTVPADGKPGPTDFVGAQGGGVRVRRRPAPSRAGVSPLVLAGGAAALLLLAGGAYAALGGRR